MAEEHQTYHGCVQRFQSWLLSKTKELTDLMERDDAAENKLRALQVRLTEAAVWCLQRGEQQINTTPTLESTT